MERLIHLRKNKNISQGQMAKILGITQQAYCNYEKGIRQIPDDLKIKLADFYSVSVDYLLGRTDDPNPPGQPSITNIDIPPVLQEVGVAFHGGPNSLSQEDVNEMAKFVEFLRAKKKEEDNKKGTP